jgi:hypothetical protein
LKSEAEKYLLYFCPNHRNQRAKQQSLSFLGAGAPRDFPFLPSKVNFAFQKWNWKKSKKKNKNIAKNRFSFFLNLSNSFLCLTIKEKNIRNPVERLKKLRLCCFALRFRWWDWEELFFFSFLYHRLPRSLTIFTLRFLSPFAPNHFSGIEPAFLDLPLSVFNFNISLLNFSWVRPFSILPFLTSRFHN